jgi:hypothetical protein
VQAGDLLGLEGTQVPFSASGATGDVVGTVSGLPVVGSLIDGLGGLPLTLSTGLLNLSVVLEVDGPGTPAPPGSSTTTTSTPGQQTRARFAGVRLSRRTLKVGRSGRARIPVSCPAAASGSCGGTLVLRTIHPVRMAGPRLKLASARFAVSVGRTKSVLVRISRGGGRALARHHRVSASLTATARDGSGSVTATSRTLTVRRR